MLCGGGKSLYFLAGAKHGLDIVDTLSLRGMRIAVSHDAGARR
jgi:hypothetical protein